MRIKETFDFNNIENNNIDKELQEPLLLKSIIHSNEQLIIEDISSEASRIITQQAQNECDIEPVSFYWCYDDGYIELPELNIFVTYSIDGIANVTTPFQVDDVWEAIQDNDIEISNIIIEDFTFKLLNNNEDTLFVIKNNIDYDRYDEMLEIIKSNLEFYCEN